MLDAGTIIILALCALLLFVFFVNRKRVIALFAKIFKPKPKPAKVENPTVKLEEKKPEVKEEKQSFGKLLRTPPVEAPKPIDKTYDEVIGEEVEKIETSVIQENLEEVNEESSDIKRISSALFSQKPLARAIRELPPQLKALLVCDILGRKDDF